jgi:signal transduction histidine kinase
MSKADGTAPVKSYWQQFLLTPDCPSDSSPDILWAVALAIGAATLASTWSQFGTALDILNVIGGIAASLSLFGRRSHPVAVALVTTSALAVSPAAAPAAILALANLALFRGLRTYAIVAAYTIAMVAINSAVYTAKGGFVAALPSRALIALLAIGMGLVARAQRHRLHSEQQERVEQAKAAERARIAREMHDVLAHRISLLSVHAGALEFHPDASPDDVAHAAGVIRESAHAALGELRQVIGLLREPAEIDGPMTDAPPERPQPTLADLPRLVEESRQAGMNVALDFRLGHPDAVPDSTARAAYRVVQEGLTNARKHAPASAVGVGVALSGSGRELTVSVVNRPAINGSAPAHDPSSAAAAHALSLPGAGTGLIGLAERVTLAGGTLTHAPTPDGGYALHATLPLPA